MTPEARSELLALASQARALAEEKARLLTSRAQPESLADMVDRMAAEHWIQGYEHCIRFFEEVANLPECARCGQPCVRSVKSPDGSHIWNVHVLNSELRCLEGSA